MSSNNTLKIINELKNKGEDFEWYPTTREIIEAMYWDLLPIKYGEDTYRANGKKFSFLDVGAGNCKVLKTIEEIANEQPLLDRYHYPKPLDEDYFKACTLKSINKMIEYGRRFEVVVSKDAETKTEKVYLDQLMVIVKDNQSLEGVDLSNLEDKDSEIILSMIEKFEPSKNYRNDSERNANRIFISNYYAIEKSETLIENMPKKAIVVGTDFNENTLIDKQADIVFCNPPYTQYAEWSERIIKEANAKVIYLVIPQRWGKNGGIKNALKARKAKCSVVGTFDFLNSEDRKARAKVALLKIELTKRRRGMNYQSFEEANIDPFDLWFNESFKIDADKVTDKYESDWRAEERARKNQKEKIKNALVDGVDLVSCLVKLYNQELDKLLNNYKKLGELDKDLLGELNIKVDAVMVALKEKIKNLKTRYWKEIFDNLDSITSRLTTRTRESFLSKLMANTSIDFTTGNIRSVVVWIIKNASDYFESQMLQVYDDFTTGEGIALYKSNKNFVKDTWRYARDLKENNVKYALDYRIVLHSYRDNYWRDDNKLCETQKGYIKDIITIAKNLGFSVQEPNVDFIYLGEKEELYFHTPIDRILKVGTKTNLGKITKVVDIEEVEEQVRLGAKVWYETDRDGIFLQDQCKIPTDTFTTVKGFKNGNVHYQFAQEFIKKLNLEVGRIRGWIKTPQEACEEFDITLEEANEYWNCTYTLLPNHLNNLLPMTESNDKESSLEESEVVDFKNDIETLLNSDLDDKKVKELLLSCGYSGSDVKQFLKARKDGISTATVASVEEVDNELNLIIDGRKFAKTLRGAILCENGCNLDDLPEFVVKHFMEQLATHTLKQNEEQRGMVDVIVESNKELNTNSEVVYDYGIQRSLF